MIINKCLISNETGPVYEMVKRCDLNEKTDGSFNFFPTIHDAVHRAMDNMISIHILSSTIYSKNGPDMENNLATPTDVYRTIPI